MRLRFWVLGGVLGAIVASGGCSSKSATQLTVGVISQIQVPKELRSVRITASVNGNIKFCQTYPVDDGKTNLPQSLALAPESGDAHSVLVSVVGFDKSKNDVMTSVADDCSEQGTPDTPARILRRSRQQYVAAHNLYVPMPLRYSCYGVECAAGETCRGGRCAAPEVDSASLPEYVPDLLFGTANNCFDADNCFVGALGPAVIDADQCIYELGYDTGGKLNVRAIFEGHGVEVLDLDPNEGFTILDASRGRFQLAPGVCKPAMGGRRVVNVNASGLCPSKNVYQPLCASSGKPLTPGQSKLYVVMDQDTTMSPYIGASATTEAIAPVLGLVLSDPVFSATTQVAFRFAPDAKACAGNYAKPDVPYAFMWQAVDPVSSLVKMTTPIMTDAVAADTVLGDAVVPGPEVRRAVLYATNRDPTSDCSGMLGASIGKLTGSGVGVYVLSLRDPSESPSATTTRKTNVANIKNATVISAEGPSEDESKLAVLAGLGSLVGDLGGCVYESPSGLTVQSQLYFSNANQNKQSVPFNANCPADVKADGWGFAANGAVRVCGASCASIRAAIAAGAQVTATRSARAPTLGQQVFVFWK